MAERDALIAALQPILATLSTLDPQDPQAAMATLNERHPIASLGELAAFVRLGVEEGWLCDREANGVKFSRVAKPADPMAAGMSIDAVHMCAAGPGHTHPKGEFDLCFAVSGDPRFDGKPPGWTVYPPGSWHEPTVSGGVMDILYFLPDGAMRFEAKPQP
ncbi:MAG: DUF4863 family protein [Myxococcota bacterium]|nr:DUF4863 family protein [Myxococcota bacterium]